MLARHCYGSLQASYVRMSANQWRHDETRGDQIPSQKSLSGCLVSLLSRSLLFDNCTCRAFRSSRHSSTYSRASLMLSLTCSISTAISRSTFSRKSINSTSFFDAAADRLRLGRGESKGGGEIGRSSWRREDAEGELVIVISGTGCEVWNVRDEVEEQETECAISGKGIISDDNFERGEAVEPLAWRRELASGDIDKRKGELGMLSSIKSGFSEGAIIDSGLCDLDARGLRIRVIRCCRRGTVNLQNLVPIPRSTRDATSSRIKVPAPTLVVIAFIVNYRRGV